MTTLFSASNICTHASNLSQYCTTSKSVSFIHLYNLCFPLDNEVVIEVKYEDETFNPVGALVVKTTTYEGEEGEEVKEGNIWFEQTEMEDPSVDMDWEDENYDAVQMDFMESVAETQDVLLSQCLELVETDGLSFDDLDE